LYLADLFIHGIGGAIYDELTDELIRHFFGLEPPNFMVVSGTLLLPQPLLPSGLQIGEVERRLRHIWYHPDQYVAKPSTEAGIDSLCRQKRDWVAQHPEQPETRRARFRAILEINEKLRPHIAAQYADLLRLFHAAQLRQETERIWRHRDYAFCLYPEAELRSWLANVK
jgi:hypothetical protein